MVKPEKLLIDVFKSHEKDPEEYMATTQETDTEQSIALAAEHNKQILAGQQPQIIEELITPEHIQIHDALIKSGQLDNKTKKIAIEHTMEEVRLSGVSGVGKKEGGQGGPGQEFPSVERNPGLTKPMSDQQGLSKDVVLPPTASDLGSPAPNKPIVR